ncbi:hypothetical protein QVD99_007611 [Batrachochytrium dendrobatidis]|nr:hypothetical protein O5D80_004991 [Batrachochytrium dendrobatidis]KAK5665996.1 hypothetical protein QVD99_007611 [Batrachochytrium dendrobatidis]
MIKNILFIAVSAAFYSIHGVCAYGKLGHWLSGRIAQELLNTESTALALQLLPQYHGQLAGAASWADEIKSKPAFSWTKSLHYINPVNDHPPEQCSYEPGSRDCPNNICVVAAIHNYTQRLISPPKDENVMAVREESLKFLLHYIGDLHQPLHVTGRDRGGNSAQVRFNGRLTSLHGVWDSLMFEKRIRDDFGGNKDKYVEYMVQQMSTTWRNELPEWITCPNTNTSIPVCPEKWARYSNIVNCVYVWKDYRRKFEMSGKYYTTAIPVAEKLLAQSALRFAAVFGASTMEIGNNSLIIDAKQLATPMNNLNQWTNINLKNTDHQVDYGLNMDSTLVMNSDETDFNLPLDTMDFGIYNSNDVPLLESTESIDSYDSSVDSNSLMFFIRHVIGL